MKSRVLQWFLSLVLIGTVSRVGTEGFAESDPELCAIREKEFRQALRREWERAESICTAAQFGQSCPDWPVACLRELRSVAQKSRQWKRAAEWAKRITEFDQAHSRDFLELGQIYVELSELSKAREAFQRAEADPETWSEARYHRLLLLKASDDSSRAEQKLLWKELRDRNPESKKILVGMMLFLAQSSADDEALQLFFRIRPEPKLLTQTDEWVLDEFVLRTVIQQPENRRAPMVNRWVAWTPQSKLRRLFSADLSLRKKNWFDAERKTKSLLLWVEQGDERLSPWLGQIHLLHGIALSHIGRHRDAAYSFDYCSVQEIPLCQPWLVRELAYLGRWDLAYLFWKQRSQDPGLNAIDRKALSQLMALAEKKGAQSMIDQKLEPPRFMKTKLPVGPP